MENRNQNVKAIVEAGMISALMVILSLVIVYTGLGPIFAVSILPIPITILLLRQNIKTTLIATLVSTILVAFLFNPIQAVANTFLYGLVGIGLGFLLKKKFSPGKTIGIFGLIVAMASFLDFVIYANFVYKLGITGFIDFTVKQYYLSFDMAKNLLGPMADNAQQNGQIELLKRYLNTNLILKLLPASIIISGYSMAYLNYIITRSILKRLKYETEEMVRFTKVYIPNKVGAFMIIIVLVGYMLKLKKLLIGDYIYQSSLLVLVVAFAISGISLTAYYLMNKYRVSKSMVIIILVAAFIFNLYQSFVILGLIDLVMNFRKLDPSPILKK